MAANRDSDTSLWLHNKLGTSSEWTSGSICSQLNKEVLRNIKDCFADLQTQVKLKLLLSFFHIPRRLVEEVKKIVHIEKDYYMCIYDVCATRVNETKKQYREYAQFLFRVILVRVLVWPNVIVQLIQIYFWISISISFSIRMNNAPFLHSPNPFGCIVFD